MDSHALTNALIFILYFLAIISFLSALTKRMSFPFTASLLLIGFFTNFMLHVLHVESHITLDSNMIYFVLLPLLLFDSAMKLNFHQFHLQFKTITFMASFGLLLSVFIVGVILTYVLNLPFLIALLFGALISATDPIAVIALFKQLGAPNRLKLVAEGESMFNDATGVIAFRVVLGLVTAEYAVGIGHLAFNAGMFVYLFVASLLFGGLAGYLVAQVIAKIENDLLVETTFTIALAIGSFVLAEHLFHLSGVISATAAGLVMGNVGRTKISSSVTTFINEFWEYIGFLAISMVFFFAAFNIDIQALLENPIRLGIAVAAVLIARTVSVYVSAWLSNKLPIFKDEPNLPTSWQHILNWGGMRGVIPLVLVYAIPDSVTYKAEILNFTFATFLFTLLVNGLTVEWLIKRLNIHLPKKEEEILKEELGILKATHARAHVHDLSTEEFDPVILKDLEDSLKEQEVLHRNRLIDLAEQGKLLNSLRIQAIIVEKATVERLFNENHIHEGVFYDLDAELDLQHDALEYPEVYTGRGFERGGTLNRERAFRQTMRRLNGIAKRFPVFRFIIREREEQLIEERIALLKARLVAAEEVITYLSGLATNLKEHSEITSALQTVLHEYEEHIRTNKENIKELAEKYPEIAKNYQMRVVQSVIQHQIQHHETSKIFLRH